MSGACPAGRVISHARNVTNYSDPDAMVFEANRELKAVTQHILISLDRVRDHMRGKSTVICVYICIHSNRLLA